MSDENKTFPLEKILTMSAKDYCNMYSKKIKDYTAIGIHVDNEYFTGDHVIHYFAKIVPKTAEVVVDFQHSVGGEYPRYYASGVALVPKEKKNEEKNE